MHMGTAAREAAKWRDMAAGERPSLHSRNGIQAFPSQIASRHEWQGNPRADPADFSDSQS